MRKYILLIVLSITVLYNLGSQNSINDKKAYAIELEKSLGISEQDMIDFNMEISNKQFLTFECYAQYYITNNPVYKAERALERKREIDAFLNHLSFKESSHNWKVVNRYGYIGKYQFGKAVLRDFGLSFTIDTRKFIRNPWIFPEKMQDSLIIDLMESNKKFLKPYLDEHRNTMINGILINDASVLAAAHLVGKGSMQRFFETDGRYVRADANSVKATDYMREFQHFDFVL